jgi:photosystem II stability/assembly factor-like uncharacterized protein
MKHILIYLTLIFSTLNVYSQIFGWSEKNTGVTVSLNSVFVEYTEALACGDSGVVLRTVNTGNNWVRGAGLPSNIKLNSICGYSILSNGKCLVSGNIGTNTFVYQSTNSGLNWTQIFTQPNGHINAVWINNLGKALLLGDPVDGRWSIWKSTDYGATFDSAGLYLPQSGSETGHNNSLWINYTATKIWFGTNNSRIYYSSNFGGSWSVQNTGAVTDVYSIWFIGNETKGFAGGSTMLYTTNTGINWATVSVPGTGNIYGISGQLSEWIKGYVRGDKIFYTIIPANNYESQYTAPNGIYKHISFPNTYSGGGQLMAVRNNGGLSRYGYDFIGIKPVSSNIPDKLFLHQNYPNPFNPITKIKFEVGASTTLSNRVVRLVIYNLLGQKIETLVNQSAGSGLSPSTYEVEFDGSNLASGIYYYTLSVNDHVYTRKMVLLK